MIVTVEVTQDDIDRGVVDDCERCPIARAIVRLLVSGGAAFVDGNEIVLGRESDLAGHKDVDLTTPSQASAFVARFDGGLSVKPFSFDLDIPEALLAGGGAVVIPDEDVVAADDGKPSGLDTWEF